MPGRAVDIPNLPLQTGAAYPPANVMFILDDSGSMTWRYMYNTQVPKISYVNTSGRNDSSEGGLASCVGPRHGTA